MNAETIPIADLKPHPRNYRSHPDDQIDHIVASIEANGLYRPVVTARARRALRTHG